MASHSLLQIFTFFPVFHQGFWPFVVNFIWQCNKTIGSCFWRAYIKLWMHLGSLESMREAPRATLTLLSCFPNFARAAITRYTHAKHEPIIIVNWGASN